MGNDQTHQLAGRGINRANDVLPDVTPLLGLGRTRASLDPFMARSGISFEPGFIPKENFTGRVFQNLEELTGGGFAAVFPRFEIRRRGHRAGNLADVIMLMKVAHQRAIAEVNLPLLAQPAAKLDDGPMGFARSPGSCAIPSHKRLQLTTNGWR